LKQELILKEVDCDFPKFKTEQINKDG